MEKENVFFGIADYMAMYSPYIKRAEARELAQCYVVGLMMDGDRKSVEPMSEKVPAKAICYQMSNKQTSKGKGGFR